jgi:hypothetical protein
MFTKPKPALDRGQAAAQLQAEISGAVAAALASRVDRRDAASILENAAQNLRTQDAMVRPIL